MSTYSFEEPIGFHLVKVKRAVKTGADAYRAVLAHNGLGALATLEDASTTSPIRAGKRDSSRSANRSRFTDMICALLVNSDDYVKLGWPCTFTPEAMSEQETAKLHFIDCRGLKERHDSFSRPLTILR